MEESTGKSELAQLLRRIDLENEASRLALHGYAEVARHQCITARMERGAEHFFRLIEQGKQEEALAFMNSDYWFEKEDKPSHPRNENQLQAARTETTPEGKTQP